MMLDCLILAAGGASRFGACKLLADWNGRPLLAHVVDVARSLAPARICIVGGAFYSQLEHALPALNAAASLKPASKPENKNPNHVCPVELLEFRAWNLGLGRSLAFGVKQLQNANPVLVLLGDQPLVSAQDLQRLYHAWSDDPQKIACASFANTLGVPAIFPAHFKAHLYECRGDRGAKSVLLQYAAATVEAEFNQVVPVPMPSAEFDVDTPQDVAVYRKKII